jgi:mannose-6-phosphate isomerase-like protein (cupin superfamily)
MIIQKASEIQEQDLGALLGKPDIGIKSRQLFQDQICKNGQGYLLDFKYIVIRPGMVCPSHRNDYVEVNTIISGKAKIKYGSQEFILGEGDLAYAETGDSYELTNTGTTPLKILAVTVYETRKKNNNSAKNK